MIRRGLLAAFAMLLLAGNAAAQQGFFVFRRVDIDYYLLNYFNRLQPLPELPSPFRGHYPLMSLFVPTFNFRSHNLDFGMTERDVRASGMGGAAIATVRGASALNVNPAGLSAIAGNELYSAASMRFGSGSGAPTDRLLFDTQIVGELEPTVTEADARFDMRHAGLLASIQPFSGMHKESGLRGLLGKLSVAGGYRRLVELNDGVNHIARWEPFGIAGIEEAVDVKTAAQSRETGGIDGVVVGAATGFGGENSAIRLHVGAAMNAASGRVRADQKFTASQLTQLQVNLPGALEPAFVQQKFRATTFDFGVQGGVLGDALRLGGTYRPGYTLEATSGKYRQVELPIEQSAFIGPFATIVTEGRITDYDLELPEAVKFGGALRLGSVIGYGEDRPGLWGHFHRFLGRGTLAVDYSIQELSKTTVAQKPDSLRNTFLEDDFLFQVIDAGLSPFDFHLRSTMPVADGNAMLWDQEAIRVGFETNVVERADLQIPLRLGFETVPLSFPSLKLGPETETSPGVFEREVERNPDGTPVLVENEGTALCFGIGYRAGRVAFDAAFRTMTVDLAYWFSSGKPYYWYNPLVAPEDARYEHIFSGFISDENLQLSYAAETIAARVNSIEFSASLAF
jgi:hypothetical protein